MQPYAHPRFGNFTWKFNDSNDGVSCVEMVGWVWRTWRYWLKNDLYVETTVACLLFYFISTKNYIEYLLELFVSFEVARTAFNNLFVVTPVCGQDSDNVALKNLSRRILSYAGKYNTSGFTLTQV